MVKEGIVLGHKVSGKGIKVDRAKVEAIERMPPPRDIKGIRSFLGHVGFYRRFIRNFSEISKPLTNLLQKRVSFILMINVYLLLTSSNMLYPMILSLNHLYGI